MKSTVSAHLAVKKRSKKLQRNMQTNNRSEKKSSAVRKFVVPMLVIAGLFAIISFGTGYFKKELYSVMKVPDFELTDQNNKKISNKDMLGKVYLVEFFYSTCPTICPIMNSNLKHIMDEIDSPELGVISISIDPENDTPEILKAHESKIGIKSPNWHLLTGDRDYIGKIADQFNIYVGDKDDDSESLNHSGMIALVDQEGNIRCRFGKNNVPILYYSGLNYEDPEGLNTDLKGKYHPDRELLIEDIRKLLK